VTTRRGSLLAGLALGVPIVTTLGPLTEDFWVPSGAVLLAAPNDVAGTLRELERLLADDALRGATAERARELYVGRFDVALTVAALRGA
jgi:glycosyltransferase involved in cell wall biosynthesis